MAITAEIMRRLSAIDMPAEALREVLTIMADLTSADDNRRTRDRDRKRAVRGQSADCPRNIQDASADKGASPSPKEINQTPNPTSKPRILAGESIAILGTVLADITVTDLIAHRKALRTPITPGAAKGLVKEFVVYGNPEEAAATMMARGWVGFKAEWMSDAGRLGARAGPTSRRPSGRTVADLAAMNLDDPDIFDDPRADTSHGTAESPASDDKARSGFAGRLSEPDAALARRGALVDH